MIDTSEANAGPTLASTQALPAVEQDIVTASSPSQGQVTCEATLIVPAHNEEFRLIPALEVYGRALRQRFGEGYELLVVTNGCTDDTVLIARAFAEDMPHVRILDISEPVGKGGAVLEGFRQALGQRIAFADADGSTQPDSILSLFDGLADYDIVIGSRRMAGSIITQSQPLYRRVLGALFASSVRSLFGTPYRDTQCGAKAFRRDVAQALARTVCETRWTFDVDLLLSATALGFSVLEHPVAWADTRGSRLRFVPVTREVAKSFWQIKRRYPVPINARSMSVSSNGSLQKFRILAMNWRCIHHPQAGGAEANLFEQARLWVREGHQVTVCCAELPLGNGPSTEIIDGITVCRRGGRYSVYFFAAWYLLVHARSFDRILDVANGVPFFTPLFTRVPTSLLVHHVHDHQWFTEFSKPVAVIGRFLELRVVPLIYRGHSVIAVSPTTRDALVGIGIDPSSINVIYNGISSANVPAVLESPVSAGHRIVYVGRLKRYKRIDLLIHVTAALRSDFPDVHLDIAGDGDARAEIDMLVSELGMHDHVTMHGFVDEETKVRLLSRATVFATPSMHEGWGLSVLEANACSCPAVAFDVPGLSVAIRHQETGLLAKDNAGFQAAIATLLREPVTRQRYANASVSWAARFTWTSSAAETLNVLRAAERKSQGVLARAKMDTAA